AAGGARSSPARSLRGGASTRRRRAPSRRGPLHAPSPGRPAGSPGPGARQLGGAARAGGRAHPARGGGRRRRAGRGAAGPGISLTDGNRGRGSRPARRSTRGGEAVKRLLVVLAVVTWASAAEAHKPSDSYLTLRHDGAHVEGQWDIALRDL